MIDEVEITSIGSKAEQKFFVFVIMKYAAVAISIVALR